MKIYFEDNSLKILTAFEQAKKNALFAIGATAERHAKNIITRHKRVDTGRMRNSVAHAEDKDATYVGTNVEYAIYNEVGTTRMTGIHFLQKAASNYSKEYREIAKQAMESQR